MRLIALFLLFLLTPLSVKAVTFIDIWQFQVSGNTLLDEALIQQRLKPYLGVARTYEEVEQAANTLQALYRDAGYPAVFVEIPNQTVTQGIFKLSVTETTIRRFKVTEAEYFLPSLVRKSMPNTAKGAPLNLLNLQEDLKYINALNQDLNVVPVITAGPTSDTVDLEISVDDKDPSYASFEWNNYHSESTTPSRAKFEVGYSNLWQKFHNVSIQAQVTPEDFDETRVFSASYVAPLGLQGDKLAFYTVLSDSTLNTVGGSIVEGDGFIFGVRSINPIIQNESGIHTLILGLDYKDFGEDVLTAGETLSTPISYTSFTGQYSRFGRQDGWTDAASLAISIGIRGLSNSNEEFNRKRSRAEPGFYVLKGSYERTYLLWGGEITGRIKGQFSDSTLVSNEQYTAGGTSSVRGYFESQVSADVGFSGGFEYSTLNLLSGKKYWFNDLRVSAFLEGAYLKNRFSGIDEEKSFGISSVGFGSSGSMFSKIDWSLEVGFPIEEILASSSTNNCVDTIADNVICTSSGSAQDASVVADTLSIEKWEPKVRGHIRYEF